MCVYYVFASTFKSVNRSGASIPGGLGEQSPTFLKVGGGLKDWLFQLIRGTWIVRRIREKPAISDISEYTYAKVTYFYRLLLVVTLGIPVMPRVNRDLKLCVRFCKQHKSIHSSVQI